MVLSTAQESNIDSGGLNYQALSGDRTIEQSEPKRFFEVYKWKIIVNSELRVDETVGRTRINQGANVFEIFQL